MEVLPTPRRPRPKAHLLKMSEFDVEEPFLTNSEGGRPTLSAMLMKSTLDTTQQQTNIVCTTLDTLYFYKHHLELLSHNKLLNPTKQQCEPRSPRSPRKKSDADTSIEQLMKHYRKLGDHFISLTAQIANFQHHFASYSHKQLLQLFTSVYKVVPDTSDGDDVLYGTETMGKRMKVVKLCDNFLLISKKTRTLESIYYISKAAIIPLSQVSLELNKYITLEFEDPSKFQTWLNKLNSVKPWFEVVPRRLIKSPDNTSIFFNKVGVPVNSLGITETSVDKTTKAMTPKSTQSPSMLSPRTKNILNIKFVKRTKTKTVKIVGLSLDQLANEHNFLHIPKNVSMLIKYIKEKGAHIEGIFRVSGSKEKIELILSKVDSKIITFDLLASVDIHSVAGALKLYIKSLPDQVVPKSVDEKLYELWRFKDSMQDNEVLNEFKEVFSTMPPLTYAFLRELLDLLKILSDNQQETKMTVENCVTCLQPSLRGYPFVYTYSIIHYTTLFPPQTEITL
ncbi:hypothetical protein EIN_134430 [Entamoeba invadens IP1]|uniref:Rho-GAP domain-containing protein n=1 Tax=Entamoeba invadens IP1 TaxID=370355 RepID=A0A0A1U2W8_ENTIV|nr:hypothetical protein EIN_134430 [Entamoeba invadens IP1]ELP85899.1 hypothetical protein EIN_134430 [Entamoeba invadens IP1]|eukprot:XP_004185245.1 hypothetical protein EIN_134430 [Entamoeba invadens IP1]